MATSSMDGEYAIVFATLDRGSEIYSYGWLLEWSTSSFYVKSTYRPLQLLKLSIHDDDPKHPGKQHFRLDFDHEDPAMKAAKAGGSWKSAAGVELPLYFRGRQVNKRAKHLVRFSLQSGLFETGIPSAPPPPFKPKASLHALFTAPAPGKVSHVDVFVSSVRPYWPKEKKVRANNAGMGPIANSSGLHLTAINAHWSADKQPDPFGDVKGSEPADECTRGIACRVDPSGFLWICEKLIPRAQMGPPALPLPPSGAPKSVV